jgi:tyrosine-protein phosphatase SIW14
MRNKAVWFLGLFFAISCRSIILAQQEPKYPELPNFHQVNQQIYRGAQPKQGGLQKLASLGVKTIINLRDDDERARVEEVEAHAAGFHYFNIPMGSFDRPTDKTIGDILAILNNSENQPVFVHCKLGADRTGTVIAIYRIEHDGWTSERAKSEAKRYGMNVWQVEMKNYISDYYKRRQESLSKSSSH